MCVCVCVCVSRWVPLGCEEVEHRDCFLEVVAGYGNWSSRFALLLPRPYSVFHFVPSLTLPVPFPSLCFPSIPFSSLIPSLPSFLPFSHSFSSLIPFLLSFLSFPHSFLFLLPSLLSFSLFPHSLYLCGISLRSGSGHQHPPRPHLWTQDLPTGARGRQRHLKKQQQ